jgi:mannitol/fructose-specific phosphotransferase system IIA component (Ntr-type)
MESPREDEDIDAMLATMERFAIFAADHADDQELDAVRKIVEMFLDEERRKSL